MRTLTKPFQPADPKLMQHNSLTAPNNLIKDCVSVHDNGQVDKTEQLTTAEHRMKSIGLFCQRAREMEREKESAKASLINVC